VDDEEEEEEGVERAGRDEEGSRSSWISIVGRCRTRAAASLRGVRERRELKMVSAGEEENSQRRATHPGRTETRAPCLPIPGTKRLVMVTKESASLRKTQNGT